MSALDELLARLDVLAAVAKGKSETEVFMLTSAIVTSGKVPQGAKSRIRALERKYGPRRYNMRAKITAALRDEWRRSPNRYAVIKEARVAPNHYGCIGCCTIIEHKDGDPTPYRIDHIEPVIPLIGFVDWNNYIERLNAPPLAMQLLCISCHDVKTAEENELRRALKELGFTNT